MFFNFLPACGDCCHPMIALENSLDPEIRPHKTAGLTPNLDTETVNFENIFEKQILKNQEDDKKACQELTPF